MTTNDTNWEKLVHGGLAAFGIVACLTAEGAEGGRASFGYLLLGYLGFAVTTFVVARLWGGTFGRKEMRFAYWIAHALFGAPVWRRMLARRD